MANFVPAFILNYTPGVWNASNRRTRVGDAGRRSAGIRFRRPSLLTGGTMRQILAACIAAAAITAAACSDETGPNRPLSLTLAGDSSVDSTPPGKPGPVASVTVPPPGDTLPLPDSARLFPPTPAAQRQPLRQPPRK